MSLLRLILSSINFDFFRVMATALTILIGRAGSLFGSTYFALLIDDHCTALIVGMAAQLFRKYFFILKT